MPFDGPDGYVAGLEALARAFEPRVALPVSQWAAKYRVLSGKSASEPGRWRNERIPYLGPIMDSLDPRHPAPLVLFVASSQVGKSECGLNWLGRMCHQMPGSFLALFPTEKVARKWVRTRLDSMIATTPALRALLPLGRRANGGNTLQEKHGPGFVIFTGSANIPDDVASISVPYLLFDEVDRMPLVLDGEGDPVELALRRSANFPRSKAFFTSTPTTEESSRVWPLWLSSTMDEYFVPCPLCGAKQKLAFDGLKWVDGKPETAEYECAECENTFPERHKTDMLVDGQWRAKHPELEAVVKGWRISGLYTPIGLGDSWGKHAAAWERARGKPAKVQVFFNTRLGEVVKSEKIKLEWEAVKERREPYTLRTIPAGVLVLTAFADIQVNRIEAGIVGWGRDEQATIIDDVVFYGDPTRDEVWQQLDAWHASSIVNSFGVEMRIAAMGVDSGNWQQEVLDFTRSRRSRGIFATKGSNIRSKFPIGKPSLVDINFRGQTVKRGAEQYQIGVSVLKTTLYRRLLADAGTPEKPVLPAERHFHFSVDLPDEYFRQLTAERFDEKDGWQKVYDHNEKLDIVVGNMAIAMHHSVAVHRYREADWVRAETLYQPATRPAAGALAPPTNPRRFVPIAAKVN